MATQRAVSETCEIGEVVSATGEEAITRRRPGKGAPRAFGTGTIWDETPNCPLVNSPQYSPARSGDRRAVMDRRARDERRAAKRRVADERRHLTDRRAPTEPPAEHLRNALQLLTDLTINGRLHYDDRLELEAARRRLTLALDQLERDYTA